MKYEKGKKKFIEQSNKFDTCSGNVVFGCSRFGTGSGQRICPQYAW